MSRSGYEHLLIQQCKLAKLPDPTPEFRFASPRRWKFDLAWPDHMLAVEVEGAVWARGRHTRGAGYEADCLKYNKAALLGWRVLRFSTGHVKAGVALTSIEEAFASPSASAVGSRGIQEARGQ